MKEFAAALGALLALVTGVLVYLGRLRKQNTELKKKLINEEFKNVEDDFKHLDLHERVKRANELFGKRKKD